MKITDNLFYACLSCAALVPHAQAVETVTTDQGILNIPVSFDPVTKHISDFGNINVYVKHNGSYTATPSPGYKFCGYQKYVEGASSGADFQVNNSLKSDGSLTFSYDVPCGGGGVSTGTVTDIIAFGISAALTYFTAGTGTAATGSLMSVLSAAASGTGLTAALATYAFNNAWSQGAAVALTSNSFSAGTCGIGDRSNSLKGSIGVYVTKSYLSCPAEIYPGWTNFSNQQPNTPNPATPAILSAVMGLLLEDDEATSTPTAQTISFGAAPTLTVGKTATVSATATSGLAASFSSKTPSICTVAGSTVTGVAAGTCTIAADQSGNGSYGAAPQVTQNITVQAAANGQTPVCTLSASPVVIAAGGSAKLTANCTPAAASYSWSNSGFASNASNGTVAPTATTQYSVTGNNSAGNGQAAAATVYVCNTPPSPNYPGLVLSGTGGTDQFTSSIGNDAIDGAAGIDTVIYNCNRSAFTVTKTATGWTISSTVEGSDTLTNVERIRFGDETLALDLDGSAGKGFRVYQAAFNRKPDVGGLKYWIGQMDAGMDQREVAARFIDSNEFRALYGDNPSNADFLTKLYNNVLHRAPDPGGYAWWLGKLNDGTYDKPWVLASFAESPENQAGVIGDILKGIDLPN